MAHGLWILGLWPVDFSTHFMGTWFAWARQHLRNHDLYWAWILWILLGLRLWILWILLGLHRPASTCATGPWAPPAATPACREALLREFEFMVPRRPRPRWPAVILAPHGACLVRESEFEV